MHAYRVVIIRRLGGGEFGEGALALAVFMYQSRNWSIISSCETDIEAAVGLF